MAESSQPSKRVRFEDSLNGGSASATAVPTPTLSAVGNATSMPAAAATAAFAVPVSPATTTIPPNAQREHFQFNTESGIDGMFSNQINVHTRRLQTGSPEFNAVVAPMNTTPGFNALAALVLHDPYQAEHFRIQSAYISRANGGNINNITGYYCDSADKIRNILNSGCNIGQFKNGFFGKGANFNRDFLTANNKSPERGKPNAVRLLLVCDVILGHTKEFELGRFDRALVLAPEGYQSVRGFINRDYEYVVYNQNQILPRYLVFYNFSNTALEMERSTNLPQGVQGTIVYITAPLSDFFGKLQQRGTPEQQPAIKGLIARLLKQSIDVKQFLTEISNLLKALPPADLESKLTVELTKCRLTPTRQQAIPSPTTVSNTGAAAAAAVGIGPAPTQHGFPVVSQLVPPTRVLPVATGAIQQQHTPILASSGFSQRHFGTLPFGCTTHPILNVSSPIIASAINPAPAFSTGATLATASPTATTSAAAAVLVRTPSIEAAATLISIGYAHAGASSSVRSTVITIDDDEEQEDDNEDS